MCVLDSPCREHPMIHSDHGHLIRARSLETGLKFSSSPPQSRSNGHRRPAPPEASDVHICVLCLKALMNNSVSPQPTHTVLLSQSLKSTYHQ